MKVLHVITLGSRPPRFILAKTLKALFTCIVFSQALMRALHVITSSSRPLLHGREDFEGFHYLRSLLASVDESTARDSVKL